MTSISVVIPTIHGRETLYEQTVAAYRETAGGHDLEVITARDHPTIGQAWQAGAEHATGEYLHLSADDVLPAREGWIDDCIEAVGRRCYPVPRIVRVDASVEACGSLGGGMLLGDCPDWTPCVTSPFPFMRRPAAPLGIPPIHYYADDYLAHVARVTGQKAVVRRGYELIHLEGTVGRPRMQARAHADRQAFLSIIAQGAPQAAAA